MKAATLVFEVLAFTTSSSSSEANDYNDHYTNTTRYRCQMVGPTLTFLFSRWKNVD